MKKYIVYAISMVAVSAISILTFSGYEAYAEAKEHRETPRHSYMRKLVLTGGIKGAVSKIIVAKLGSDKYNEEVRSYYFGIRGKGTAVPLRQPS